MALTQSTRIEENKLARATFDTATGSLDALAVKIRTSRPSAIQTRTRSAIRESVMSATQEQCAICEELARQIDALESQLGPILSVVKPVDPVQIGTSPDGSALRMSVEQQNGTLRELCRRLGELRRRVDL